MNPGLYKTTRNFQFYRKPYDKSMKDDYRRIYINEVIFMFGKTNKTIVDSYDDKYDEYMVVYKNQVGYVYTPWNSNIMSKIECVKF